MPAPQKYKPCIRYNCQEQWKYFTLQVRERMLIRLMSLASEKFVPWCAQLLAALVQNRGTMRGTTQPSHAFSPFLG